MIKVGSEREIQFDKTLRYKRQQDYDITKYELVPFVFGEREYQVYKNFNLSIFIDDYCNADCKFCVAQLRYEHKNAMYQKVHIKDDAEYLRRLEEVLTYVRPLNPSISITGGEPTLCKNLTEVLKIVDRLGFRKRTITTNGSGLFNIQDGRPIIENLMKYNWDHLNISRAHFDDSINRAIMRYCSEREYCDNAMLHKILKTIDGSNLKHRLSCLLLKEGIGSVQDIKNYVEFYVNRLGANNFIFRELMDYDKTAVNLEKMRYCDDNKVRLNDIWQDFENYPELVPYLNLLGYYYYVEIYKYKNATIASESANLNQQYVEKGKNQDVVYEMVFHNNGNLCGSWIDSEEILMQY